MSEKKKQELKVVSTPKAPARMADDEIRAWAKVRPNSEEEGM